MQHVSTRDINMNGMKPIRYINSNHKGHISLFFSVNKNEIITEFHSDTSDLPSIIKTTLNANS